MHIAIEGHGFFGEGGSQTRYVYELVRGLARIDRKNRYTIFLNSLRKRLSDQKTFQRQLENSNFSYVLTPFPNLGSPWLKRLRSKLIWPLIGRHIGIDIFHSTAQHKMYHADVPSVLTVHDLAGIAHPEWFPDTRFARKQKATALRDIRNTTLVLASSENTSQDVCRLAGVSKEQVRTVLLGVNLDRFHPVEDTSSRETLRRYGVSAPYFLHVGDLVPRKNLDRLIRVFARLKEQKSIPHQLVLMGKRNYGSPEIYTLPESLGVGPDVIFTGYVPEVDLPAFYSAARGFLYPSMYEGFGLPLLEAMACGAPVVCSNAASLVEVVGDDALVLHPTDESGWQQALSRLVDDELLHSRLREKGLARTQRFSWDRTAQNTLSVYQELGAE